jgi:hypothetical protein
MSSVDVEPEFRLQSLQIIGLEQRRSWNMMTIIVINNIHNNYYDNVNRNYNNIIIIII